MAQSEIVDNFTLQFVDAFKEINGTASDSLLLGSQVLRSYRHQINSSVSDANPDMEFMDLIELQDKVFRKKISQTGRPNFRESSDKDTYFFKTFIEKKLNNYDLIFMSSNIGGIRRTRYDKSFQESQSKKKFSSKSQSGFIKQTEEDGSSVYLYQNMSYYFSPDITSFVEASKHLNKKGYSILCSKSEYVNEEAFEGILNELGLYINAIYQESFSSSKHRQTILVISKTMNNSIFIADLDQHDNLPIKYISKSKSDEKGSVSYYKDSSTEKYKIMFDSIKEKRFQGNSGELWDDHNGDTFKTVDLEYSSIKESCKGILSEIHASTRYESCFLLIKILSKSESRKKESKLKKSQVLYLLREHPRVLAYDSLANTIGSKDSVFIYLDPKYKEPLIRNFFLGKNNFEQEKNLKNGYFIKRESFNNIDQLRSQDEVEKNKFFFYQDYKETLLGDLVDSYEGNNSSFDKKLDRIFRRDSKEKGAVLSIKRRVFLQTVLDDQLAVYFDNKSDDPSYLLDGYNFYFKNQSMAKYLEVFFHTEIGRQMYLASMKFLSKGQNRFSKDEVLNLKVLVPKNEVMLGTISAYEKITQLEKSVSDLHKSFSQNPKGTISKRLDMLDDMLEVAGKLNKSDIVFSTIRGDEKGDAEFKASWRLPINDDGTPGSRKDEEFEGTSFRTEAAVLRVISSFINTRGGRLIIGVNDERNIVGLKDELRIFYGKNFKSLKKQKDAFDLDFGQSLRTYFELDFIGQDKNITSEFVDIEGSNDFVYLVTCTPSDKACLVKKVTKGKRGKGIAKANKNKEYFVRKKSESIALEGTKMVAYITDRLLS
jgi:hypothetical protein